MIDLREGKMNWFLIAVATLILAGVVWTGTRSLRASATETMPVTARAPDHPPTETIEPMAEPQFWALVGRTTAFEAEPQAQLQALDREFDKLSPTELEAYEARFDALMKTSYRLDLWGAAYIVHGGASDDGFEYFRCWLISKGQKVFEAVAADPDHLADLVGEPGVSVGDGGYLEFESFAYAARTAWERKTGHDAGEMPTAADMFYPGVQPGGKEWTEDELPGLFPKLWARFGAKPLP